MHKERRVVFAFACALVMLTGAGAAGNHKNPIDQD